MGWATRLPGRRLLWGGLLIVGSAVLAWAAHRFTEIPSGGPNLVFFLTTGHNLRFLALSVSGPATAAGLLMVLPPFLGLIRRRWIRLLTGSALGLASAAGALLFLLYWFLLRIFVDTDYALVKGPDGERVVVVLDHFNRADFDIYRHASGVLYDAVLSGTVAGESILDPDSCTLEPAAAGPVLTCGQGAWQLPKP